MRIRPVLESLSASTSLILNGCDPTAPLGGGIGNGDGLSSSTPIQICSVSQFQSLSITDPINGDPSYYKLSSDLDFSGTNFSPISFSEGMHLDGGNFTLSNINVNLDTTAFTSASVFNGVGQDSSIQNLNFNHVTLQNAGNLGASIFGAIDGYDIDTGVASSNVNHIKISNVTVIAPTNAAIFANSANDVGIDGVKINNSFVASSSTVGGVIAQSTEGLTISNVEADVNVIAAENAGSFAGILNGATVTDVVVNSRFNVTNGIKIFGTNFPTVSSDNLSNFVGSDANSVYNNIGISGQFLENATTDLNNVGGIFGTTNGSQFNLGYVEITGQADLTGAIDSNVQLLVGNNSGTTFSSVNAYNPGMAVFSYNAIAGITPQIAANMLKPPYYPNLLASDWTKTTGSLPILAHVQTAGFLYGTSDVVVRTKVTGAPVYLDFTPDASGNTFANAVDHVDTKNATLNLCNKSSDAIKIISFGTQVSQQIKANTLGTIAVGSSIAGGNHCVTYGVSFTPTGNNQQIFNDIAYVKVLDTVTGVTQIVSILVNGQGLSEVKIADGTVDMAPGNPHIYPTQTVSEIYTVTNTGGATATIISVLPTNAAAGFSVDPASNCLQSGATIASNASCNLTVLFTPAAIGAAQDSLILTYQGPDGVHQTATISATGTAVVHPFPCTEIPAYHPPALAQDGSSARPFFICSSRDLERTTLFVGTYNYIQMANINITIDGVSLDADGVTVMRQMIFNSNGTYDGNSGNVDSNICGGVGCTLTAHSTIGGLWSNYYGSIKNLNYVATMSKTDVAGNLKMGGLADLFLGPQIHNINATVSVSHPTNVHSTNGSSNANTGGLFGYSGGNVSTSNVTVNATVSGTGAVGGYAGWLQSSGTITNVNVSGSVSGTAQYIGGFSGLSVGAAISHCSSSATINASGTFDSGHGTTNGNYVGGFIGFMYVGNYSDNFATGNVTDTNGGEAGGFVGLITTAVGAVTVSQSYATGNVSCSDADCGGFDGTMNNGTITDSFSTGSVTASDVAGGFSGGAYAQPGGTIINSFSLAPSVIATSGTSHGFIGSVGSGSVTHSYYDGAVDAPNASATTTGIDASGATALSDLNSGGGVGFIDAPVSYSGFTFDSTHWSSRAHLNTPSGNKLLFPVPTWACTASLSTFNGSCD